jgi:hypothetical protein
MVRANKADKISCQLQSLYGKRNTRIKSWVINYSEGNIISLNLIETSNGYKQQCPLQ